MQVALETELAQMLSSEAKPEMPQSGQDELPKSDVENQTDEETEPQSPQRKAARADDCGHFVSLADVLKVADLANFHPPKDDTDEQAIARTRAFIPGMLSFSVFMRCGEGLLSRAAVLGRTKARISPFHQAEHALAMARSAHMCDAGRQTRHQLWCDFASQSLQTAGVEASEGKCVTKLGPPTKVENGHVVYQLLVVKPAAAASAGSVCLRFCVPTSVWRVARRKVKSGKRLMTEGQLPIEYISRLQVMLLMPRQNPNNKSSLDLDGSALSPMATLDPLDGSVIYEVPAACFQVIDGPHSVCFKVSKDALKAFQKVAKSIVPLQNEKEKKIPNQKIYMTEFDFVNTSHGRKCQVRFLELMKKDYEAHHHKISGKNGITKLPKGYQCKWEELCHRLPGYFSKRYSKGSATWKALSAEEKSLGFGALVLKEFQSIAPTPENGDKFMKWLLDVHMTAPAIVAFDPEPKTEP